MNAVTAEQLNAIRTELNNLYHKQSTIIDQDDALVKQYATVLWQQLITEKKIDADWVDKQARKVDIDTMTLTNVREIGTDWICYNTWNKLQLTEFLQSKGWNETQIQLAATQIIPNIKYK